MLFAKNFIYSWESIKLKNIVGVYQYVRIDRLINSKDTFERDYFIQFDLNSTTNDAQQQRETRPSLSRVNFLSLSKHLLKATACSLEKFETRTSPRCRLKAAFEAALLNKCSLSLKGTVAGNSRRAEEQRCRRRRSRFSLELGEIKICRLESLYAATSTRRSLLVRIFNNLFRNLRSHTLYS